MTEDEYRFDPQSSFSDLDSYFIKLDKRWKLDELSDFSKIMNSLTMQLLHLRL